MTRSSLALTLVTSGLCSLAIAHASLPAIAEPTASLPPSAAIPILVPPPEQPSFPINSTGGLNATNWLAFAQPDTNQAKSVALWATYYYVHQATPVSEGFRLLNLSGKPLGPKLTRRDWCYAAVQGVVQVPSRWQGLVTYGFAGRGNKPQADCSSYFTSLSKDLVKKVGSARFKVTTAPYGYASGKYRATPFRTIAVDRSQIPIGSVLYIPEANGVPITLPSGEQVIHDGYFYAADVGSAIKGNHIDIFIGPTKENPFSFVKSHDWGTFQAYLVNDPEIQERLRSQHQLR